MVIKLPKNCDTEIIKYSKVIVIQQTFFLPNVVFMIEKCSNPLISFKHP